MQKILLLIFSVGLLCFPGMAKQSFAQPYQGRSSAGQQTVTQSNRISFMQGILPLPINEQSQQDQQLYAVAAYLFNMYINNRVYPPMTKGFSLDYLGTLDPFFQLPKPQMASSAQALFMDDHNSSKIYQYLNEIMINEGFGARLFKPESILNDVKRLTDTYYNKDGKPVYSKPVFPLPAFDITTQDLNQLLPAWQEARKEGQNKVIPYETKQINTSAIDSPHASHNLYDIVYTYRWVKDECEYSSYLGGKHLLRAVEQQPYYWENARIYKITARDKKGLLRPASGEDRFRLANGQKSLAWEYHTAILVVLADKERYKYIVLDAFLGGVANPISLEKWANFFADTTYFEVFPFHTDTKVDNALRMPQAVKGNIVLINGKEYKPHPVTR